MNELGWEIYSASSMMTLLQHIKSNMANKARTFYTREDITHIVLLSSPKSPPTKPLLTVSLLIPIPTTIMNDQSKAKTGRKLELDQGVRKSLNSSKV